jgi:hypothetical protein
MKLKLVVIIPYIPRLRIITRLNKIIKMIN